MNTKPLTGLLLILLLTGYAHAVKVGVVVQYPDESYCSSCIEVPEDTDGYTLMQNANLNIDWSYSETWGHGLCKINCVGCPASNCYCSSDYWGFYIAKPGETSWSYSPVGWDMPGECWDRDHNSFDGHYCARDGDVLGYAYGPYGTKPIFLSFDEVCNSQETSSCQYNPCTRKKKDEKGLLIKYTEPVAGKTIKLTVMDNTTLEPLDDAVVEVYAEFYGSKKVYEGVTGDDGVVSFTVEKPIAYYVSIASWKYPHENLEIKVTSASETESTTTITESPTTTLPVTTTLASITTTSTTCTTTSTTTTSMSITSTTTPQPLEKEDHPPTGELVHSSGNSLGVKGWIILGFFTALALAVWKRRQ